MNRSFRCLERALDESSVDHEFFFRDDDAGWADPKLFELCDRFQGRAPLDLAVIPQAITPQVGVRLLDHSADLGFHQHGFKHDNHEPVGKKCEFGPSRVAEDITHELTAGRTRLIEVFDDRLDPIFTPPWNRCGHETLAALGPIGVCVLSRDRGSFPRAPKGMIELPVSVDWVRWRDTIDDVIVRAMAPGTPTGVMLHHAVMHAHDLSMIDDLLELLASHPRARVRSMMQIVGGADEC